MSGLLCSAKSILRQTNRSAKLRPILSVPQPQGGPTHNGGPRRNKGYHYKAQVREAAKKCIFFSGHYALLLPPFELSGRIFFENLFFELVVSGPLKRTLFAASLTTTKISCEG